MRARRENRRKKRLAAGSREMRAGFHWREPPITAHAIFSREVPSRIEAQTRQRRFYSEVTSE
jgi:hypothetical protein